MEKGTDDVFTKLNSMQANGCILISQWSFVMTNIRFFNSSFLSLMHLQKYLLFSLHDISSYAWITVIISVRKARRIIYEDKEDKTWYESEFTSKRFLEAFLDDNESVG